MKSELIMTLLCLLLQYNIYANEHKRITLSFNRNDFSIVEEEGVCSIYSGKWNITFKSDSTKPALPLIPIRILIPQNCNYVQFSSKVEQELIASGIQLRPNPRPFPTGTTPVRISTATRPNYLERSYPEENVKYVGSHDIGGYKIVSFIVYPFSFSPVDGLLSLHTSIDLDIELQTQKESFHPINDSMREYVKMTVYNKEDFPILYGEDNGKKAEGLSKTTQSPGTAWEDYQTKYLIVTNEVLKPAFEKLAIWKSKKGVKAEILTVEEIRERYHYGDQFNKDTMALNIKYAIYDYWAQGGLEYVLLGGDLDIVPSRNLYLEADFFYDHDYANDNYLTPADIFYSSFDISDMAWYENDYVNHDTSEYDMFCTPQIAVTRLAVSTINEANIQIDRIIDYEKDPIREELDYDVLMAGYKMENYTQNALGQVFSDVDAKSDAIWYGINNGSWTRFKFFDTSSSYPAGSALPMTPENLKLTIEHGFSIIHIGSHGYKDRWKLGDLSFDNTYAASLNNPRKSIILTSACKTNAIDTLCLSKAFMKNPKSGILGYWGSSRGGWSSYYYIDDYDYPPLFGSERCDSTFMKLLISSSDRHFGRIAMQTKVEMITWGLMGYDEPYRWLLYAINPLGDPEMPIYIKEPKEILKYAYYESDVLRIEISDDAYFDQETRDKLRVCVMSLGDGGHSYYWTQNVGHISSDWIEIPPIDCSVCITQPGFKPKVFNILRSGYLQNEILEGETYCISNTLTAGRDVTNLKPQGNVVIKNGSAKFFSPNGTTIQNYFEVQKGATLTIDPSGEYEGIDNPWYDYLQDD